VIRLRDGETNMLAGLIRDDERKVLEGLPGLSDLPVIGRLFAHSRMENSQTDIILTLTPHIVRVLDLDESDLLAFRVGRDSGAPAIQLPAFLPTFLPGDTPPRDTPAQPAGPSSVIGPPPGTQRPVLPSAGQQPR